MNDDWYDTQTGFWSEPDGPRLPRFALMGEFSAGKSTLANLMIGTNPLPVQVVATQMPPVLISHGTAPSVIVDLSGNETPCNIEALQDIDLEQTAFIRFFCDEDILTRCDLIDMPGISDPNMSSTVWERILPYADGVIWCTPATQAWRQSEAAVWDSIEETIRQYSMLVVTRADMLLSDNDRAKVMRRVNAETEPLFAKSVMMSLINARDGEDDSALWAQSGADEFVETFLTLVDAVDATLPDHTVARRAAPRLEPDTEPQTHSEIVPVRPVLRKNTDNEAPATANNQPDPSSYMPKFS